MQVCVFSEHLLVRLGSIFFQETQLDSGYSQREIGDEQYANLLIFRLRVVETASKAENTNFALSGLTFFQSIIYIFSSLSFLSIRQSLIGLNSYISICSYIFNF